MMIYENILIGFKTRLHSKFNMFSSNYIQEQRQLTSKRAFRNFASLIKRSIGLYIELGDIGLYS